MPIGAGTLSDDCWAHVCAFTGGSGIALAELTSTAVRQWIDKNSTVWHNALLREFDYAITTASQSTIRDDAALVAEPSNGVWSGGTFLPGNQDSSERLISAHFRLLFAHLVTARVCTFGSENSRGQTGRRPGASQAPHTPLVLPSLAGAGAVDASCGGCHSAVLDAAGTVWMFGDGRRGQLGLKVPTDSQHLSRSISLPHSVASSRPRLLPSTCTPTPLNDTYNNVDERLKRNCLHSAPPSKPTGSISKTSQEGVDSAAPSSRILPPVATLGCGASFTVAVTREVATMSPQDQQAAEVNPALHSVSGVTTSSRFLDPDGTSSCSTVEVWMWGALSPSIRSSAPRRLACFDLAPKGSTTTKEPSSSAATNAESTKNRKDAASADLACHSDENANLLSSQLRPMSLSGSNPNFSIQRPMKARPLVSKVACGEAFFVLLLPPSGGVVRAGRKSAATPSSTLSSSSSSLLLAAADEKQTSPTATHTGYGKAEESGSRADVAAKENKDSFRRSGEQWSQLWGMGVLFEDSFGSGDGEWNLGNRLVPMPQLPAVAIDRDDNDDGDDIDDDIDDDCAGTYSSSNGSEDNAENDSYAPSSSMDSQAICDVAAGHSHLIAIRACDGVAYGLGAASKGQLGIGYQAASEGTLLRFFTRTHRKVEMGPVVSVACGDFHTMWLSRDGTLWTSGLNDCGQCGLGEFNAADGSGITRAQPCVWVPRHVPGTGCSSASSSSSSASVSAACREYDKRTAGSSYDNRGVGVELVSNDDAATTSFRGAVSIIAAGGQTSVVVLASPNSALPSPATPNVAPMTTAGNGNGAGAVNRASPAALLETCSQSWPGLEPLLAGACSRCHGMGGVWSWGLVPASSSHRAPSQASPLKLHKLSAATSCQCTFTTTCNAMPSSEGPTTAGNAPNNDGTSPPSESVDRQAAKAGSSNPSANRPATVRAVNVGGGGRHVVCVLGSSSTTSSRAGALL